MATISWISPDNASWNVGSNWSTGSVPTSSDDVLINVSQSGFEIHVTAMAVAQSLTIDMANTSAVYVDNSGSTLTVGGPVTLQAGEIVNNGTLVLGGTLTVEPAGDLDNVSGVIAGGTINQAGGSIYWGTLDGVTVLGNMGSPSSLVSAAIENGLTVVNGGTPGTIYAFSLQFLGDQTQDNATFVFNESGGITANGTVTLGPNLTIEATPTSGSVGLGGTGTYINQGTIEQAGAQDGTLAAFTNQGLLIFSGNTQTLDLNNTFVNEGIAEITAGQTVDFIPTSPAIFANQDGGTIVAQGTSAYLLIASHGTAPYTNDGVIAVDQGATLDIGANLSGGTIASDGSGQILSGPYLVPAGTFEGAAVLQGTIDLVFGRMTFADSFTLQGATLGTSGVLELDGGGVAIVGSETLDSGTIDMLMRGQISADDTLDLGPDVLLNASGSADLAAGALLLNEGTILAIGGSSVTFDATSGTFDNTGTVVIGAGDVAQVLGTFINTGAFTLQAGATLDFGNVTLGGIASLVNQGGVLNISTLDGQGGTLDLTDSSPLNGVKIGTLKDITLITDGGTLDLNGSTLDNVTLHGMLSVGTDDILSITGGFTAAGLDGTGPGTIDLPGSLATVNILDTGTIDNLILNVGSDVPADALVTPDSLAADPTGPWWDTDFDADVYNSIREQQSELANKSDWLTFHPNLLPLYFKAQANLESAANFLLDGNPTLVNGLFDPAPGANLLVQNDGLTNDGTFVSDTGDAFLIDSTTLTNTGTFDADGGRFGIESALTGTGTVEVDNSGGLAILSSVAAGQTIIFEPGGGTLQLFDPTEVEAPIIGFGTNDVAIDLADINVDSIVASPGTMIAYDGSTIVARLNIVGDYTTGDYGFASDSNGGTVIGITCFLAGTHIATPDGPVPVEALRAGDQVLTASGTARPVRWIGERHLDATRHPRPENVWPVRVARGAFGPNTPCRALYLSPDHAVFAQGVLIPVKYLINGGTIRPARQRHLHYLHVELDTHDIILAEGLWVETYLDVGDRGRFENASAPIHLHPDFVALAWEARGCAPLVVAGPRLAAIQAALTRQIASTPGSLLPENVRAARFEKRLAV